MERTRRAGRIAHTGASDPNQLIDRFEDPMPDQGTSDVTLVLQLVGSLRCAYGRVDAVLIDQQLRGAEDVGVIDHRTIRSRAVKPKPFS